MKTIEESESEVATLNGRLARCVNELRVARRSRPGPALRAQEGDASELETLDGRIKELELRKSGLEDALVAARWGRTRAREEAVRKHLERYAEALKRLKPAATHLLAALGYCSECYGELDQEIKRTRAHVTYPDRPGEGILLAVAGVCGVKIVDPWILVDQPDVGQIETAIKAQLVELDARKKREPKSPTPPRSEDRATGVLGAIASLTNVARPREEGEPRPVIVGGKGGYAGV